MCQHLTNRWIMFSLFNSECCMYIMLTRCASTWQMPIKWMALECIHYRKFTHQSDVWSYGKIQKMCFCEVDNRLTFWRNTVLIIGPAHGTRGVQFIYSILYRKCVKFCFAFSSLGLKQKSNLVSVVEMWKPARILLSLHVELSQSCSPAASSKRSSESPHWH